MPTTLFEVQGKFASIGVKTVEDDGTVHRRAISAGTLIDGEFVLTDVSGESEEVKAIAAQSWTPEVVASLSEFLLSQYTPPLPPAAPTSVSARQFKLQLLASGLLDQVEAFIASQGKAVQIAYDNSGSFVRTEPMMQSGFTALGFTGPQIDAFFMAAAKL